MQAAVFENIPAAILVGAEVFSLGFGATWIGLSGVLDKPV